MEDNKKEEVKKPTWEELNNYCQQLYNQNQAMMKRLQEINLANTFKRIDYLFKVLELAKSFEGDFVKACADEITSFLTIPEEEETEAPTEQPAEQTEG